MITESQIRGRLSDYLRRRITLNEFEDWLVQQSWNMHRDSDELAQQLVGSIELRLAEYSDDHLSDEGLDRELYGLIAPSIAVAYVQNSEPHLTWETASDSTITERSWRVPAARAA